MSHILSKEERLSIIKAYSREMVDTLKKLKAVLTERNDLMSKSKFYTENIKELMDEDIEGCGHTDGELRGIYEEIMVITDAIEKLED